MYQAGLKKNAIHIHQIAWHDFRLDWRLKSPSYVVPRASFQFFKFRSAAVAQHNRHSSWGAGVLQTTARSKKALYIILHYI